MPDNNEILARQAENQILDLCESVLSENTLKQAYEHVSRQLPTEVFNKLRTKKELSPLLSQCRRSLCRIGLDRGISRALRDYKRDPSKSIDERTF